MWHKCLLKKKKIGIYAKLSVRTKGISQVVQSLLCSFNASKSLHACFQNKMFEGKYRGFESK